VNSILTLLAGLLVSFFVLISGGKENIDTTNELEPLRVDLLMPPNERVYLYFEEFAPKYDIPLKYILKCARLESNYKGKHQSDYAPYEDWLVSSAEAYSVLQVRVIAAREVWPEYNYVAKYNLLPFELYSDRWAAEQKAQDEYRTKYEIDQSIMLEYKTDEELAYLLRYDLRFNIESGIRYMRFLRNKNYSWAQVYSVYNQGWAGAHSINYYARYITQG